MRKLKRLVAKRKMKAAGLTRICSKNGKQFGSEFAFSWRSWVNG